MKGCIIAVAKLALGIAGIITLGLHSREGPTNKKVKSSFFFRKDYFHSFFFARKKNMAYYGGEDIYWRRQHVSLNFFFDSITAVFDFFEVLMLESKFQAQLIKKLKCIFPGCMVLKTDPNYIQGLPDLIILYGNKWGGLECKRFLNAQHRPNQDYYVNVMNEMSFCSFICPENEEEVLDELQSAFRSRG